MLIFLVTIAFVFLAALLYCFFIILQLALFNLIMLVVMLVFWYKIYKISRAIINRLLNNNRKKAFKSWIRELRDLSFLKELSIEQSLPCGRKYFVCRSSTLMLFPTFKSCDPVLVLEVPGWALHPKILALGFCLLDQSSNRYTQGAMW